MVALLVFIMATLEIMFSVACWTQKVHLVVNVFKKCSFSFFGLFEFLNYY